MVGSGVRAGRPRDHRRTAWSILPGSTCHWNRAACAWWMAPARSCARRRWRASRRPWLGFFRGLETGVTRIGLEAGPLSQWLYAGLVAAGFEVVLLETRHVKAALSAMVIKTDRKDARGIAQLLRMGWFRPVHAKSPAAQEVRALLVARKLLQTKLLDVEFSIRGILRGFGLKMGEVSKGRFVAPGGALGAGQARAGGGT